MTTPRSSAVSGIVGDELIVAGGATNNANRWRTEIEAINLNSNTKRTLTSLTYGRSYYGRPSVLHISGKDFFAIVYQSYTNATGDALRSIEVIYPITNTKSFFYRPHAGAVWTASLYGEDSFIYVQAVSDIAGFSGLVEVMNAYTGQITKHIPFNWESTRDGNTYVFADTCCFRFGSSAAYGGVQVFEAEVVDNDKVTIPAPKVALGSRSAQLPAKVQLPVPSVYDGVDYPANTSIQLQDNDTFELPGLPTDAQTVEVKYLLQGGEYQL